MTLSAAVSMPRPERSSGTLAKLRNQTKVQAAKLVYRIAADEQWEGLRKSRRSSTRLRSVLAVLQGIIGYLNVNGYAYPSVPTLAAAARVSVSLVYRILPELEWAGLIVRDHQSYGPNHYYLGSALIDWMNERIAQVDWAEDKQSRFWRSYQIW